MVFSWRIARSELPPRYFTGAGERDRHDILLVEASFAAIVFAGGGVLPPLYFAGGRDRCHGI